MPSKKKEAAAETEATANTADAGEGTATKTAKKATKKATAKKATTKKKATARKSTKKTAAANRLRVRQVRSTIKRQRTFKRTLEALGIRHHQDEVVVNDTPSTRGMLQKVRHLVSVTPEE